MDIAKFETTKTEAEKFYDEIKEVKCPYFKETVKFNAKGLDHLKFKDWNKARVIEDQFKRFKLLKFAPDVLKL